jgi:hypothetical protein
MMNNEDETEAPSSYEPEREVFPPSARTRRAAVACTRYVFEV